MKVKVEGNTLDLPEEICKSNKSLTDALLPFYPAVANADIKREGKGEDTVITVTKKAGTKGSFAPVIAALDAAPEAINPVLVIAATQPKKLTTATLDDAIVAMLEDEAELARVSRALDEAPAQAAQILPRGF